MLSTILLLNALKTQTSHSRRVPDPALLLALALMAGGTKQSGRGGRPPAGRERLRSMTLRRFVAEHYLPERNHRPGGPTAELTGELLERLLAATGREAAVGELDFGFLRRFRAWLAGQIASGLSPATANLRLRQLRAVWNHAARWQWTDQGKRWRIVKPPPPMEFFEEAEPDVDAWTLEENARIERQARALEGMVGTVPASVFWTAVALVFQKLGSRVNATMLAAREHYNPTDKTLLLVKKNQKQKQDQRIVLPPRAAAAVEKLLSAHDHPLIFGCWPYDPPLPRTGRRKWRVFTKHFMRLLVVPAGLSLPKGVRLRQFRRTAATICEENGGNPTELLGHSSPKITERYKDRKRRRACRQSLYIPDADPQRTFF